MFSKYLNDRACLGSVICIPTIFKLKASGNSFLVGEKNLMLLSMHFSKRAYFCHIYLDLRALCLGLFVSLLCSSHFRYHSVKAVFSTGLISVQDECFTA